MSFRKLNFEWAEVEGGILAGSVYGLYDIVLTIRWNSNTNVWLGGISIATNRGIDPFVINTSHIFELPKGDISKVKAHLVMLAGKFLRAASSNRFMENK